MHCLACARHRVALDPARRLRIPHGPAPLTELTMNRACLAFLMGASAWLTAIAAAAAPFAYVPNEKSGSISVIDTATDQVVGVLRTGGRPRGIAASLAGADGSARLN